MDTYWNEEGTLPEIGLNYDRDIGPWSLALVGLRSQDPRQYHEEAIGTDASGAVEEFTIQDIEYENVETIVRGTLSRVLNADHRIEFGGEGALNTLDSALSLTVDDGGGPVLQPIPNSNIVVEEERAEFFGVHSWTLSEAWSLETRVAWETSTLTFTGDANNATELAFWKPSLQLTHNFGGESQARVRLYRDVGQLDFNDFASAVSLADERIDGGNPDLRPQSDWRFEFGADLRFPGGAALGVTLTHHDITDVNDLVPLTATVPTPDENPGVPGDETIEVIFDAPGNLSQAEAWSLNLSLASPVPLIANARLMLDAEFWDSEVADPVTGAARIISGQPESSVEIGFRQDFPDMRWSWGFDFTREGEIQGYYLSEIDTTEEGSWLELWWETSALPNDMKLRITAMNAADRVYDRDRIFFDGDRNGSRVGRQITQGFYQTSPWLTMRLSGAF